MLASRQQQMKDIACPSWRAPCSPHPLDAMDRKRGKGPQVVRVERVVVHEGGQAIVGTVQPVAGASGRGEG